MHLQPFHDIVATREILLKHRTRVRYLGAALETQAFVIVADGVAPVQRPTLPFARQCTHHQAAAAAAEQAPLTARGQRLPPWPPRRPEAEDAGWIALALHDRVVLGASRMCHLQICFAA